MTEGLSRVKEKIGEGVERGNRGWKVQKTSRLLVL
jgi:hypothetical protein